MINSKNIRTLLNNEISTEFQSKNTIGAILLYVISTTFVAYISFKTIDSPFVWNALFWIIILFASINTISGSFKENSGQTAYLFNLVSPQEIILSKIIYNALLLLIVAILCLCAYCLFIGSFIENFLLFFTVVIVGSITLATILTLSASIAYKAGGNSSLFSILSLPIVIPVLILLVTSSNHALNNTQYKSFTYSEMYPDEKMSIKARFTHKENEILNFIDTENNTRSFQNPKGTLIVQNDYVLYGSYSLKSNKFNIDQITLHKNLVEQSDYIKILTLILIALLIGGMGLLIFPKFWTE